MCETVCQGCMPRATPTQARAPDPLTVSRTLRAGLYYNFAREISSLPAGPLYEALAACPTGREAVPARGPAGGACRRHVGRLERPHARRWGRDRCELSSLEGRDAARARSLSAWPCGRTDAITLKKVEETGLCSGVAWPLSLITNQEIVPKKGGGNAVCNFSQSPSPRRGALCDPARGSY